MIQLVSSLLASTARQWRGTSALIRDEQPHAMLTLYDMEGCPYCRPVREALTELDLDVLIKPCPKGQAGYWDELEKLSGTRRVPFLVDPNNGHQVTDSKAIIAYLHTQYGKGQLPRSSESLKLSQLASALRLAKGTRGRPSWAPQTPLELYSFESSPFSRLVRERLTELGLAYVLRNCGKQQLSDAGLPWLRPGKGPYRPVPGTNRARLMEQTGKVQLPYLYDPNTHTGLFESSDIIRYLQQQYGDASTQQGTAQ